MNENGHEKRQNLKDQFFDIFGCFFCLENGRHLLFRDIEKLIKGKKSITHLTVTHLTWVKILCGISLSISACLNLV